MKRSARARGSTGVSLFPFLAVLLCTMGALIVVLVVIARQAQSQAEQQEVVQRERLEQQQREVLAAATQIETQRAAALAQRDELQTVVAARQRELEALSARIATLESELAQLKQQADQVPETADKSSSDEIEGQLAWYRRRIAEVEGEIRAANQKHGNGKTFAILPYGGRNATDRRPIYIECQADRVLLQPGGIELLPPDFIQSRALCPLNAALLATVDHFEQLEPLGRGYAYPMLLVRPDGIESYYKVLEVLHQFRSQYGYEFIEQDWELELPPIDQQLAQKQLEAIQMARRQLMRELQTRPSLVRGKPPSFSLSATGSGLKMVDSGKPGGLDSLPDRYGADPQGNARETGRGGYPDSPLAGSGSGLPGTGGSGLPGGSGGLGLPGEPGSANGSLAGPRYPDPGHFTSTPYSAGDSSGTGYADTGFGNSGLSGTSGHAPQLTGRGGSDQASGFGSGTGYGGQYQPGMTGGGSSAFGQTTGGGGTSGSFAGGGQPAHGGQPGMQPGTGPRSAPLGTSSPADRGYWVTGGERPSTTSMPAGSGYGWGRDESSSGSTNPYANLDLASSQAGGNGGSDPTGTGGGAQGGANDSSSNLAANGGKGTSQGTESSEAGSAAGSANGTSSEGMAAGGGAGGDAGRPGSMSAGAAGGGADASAAPEAGAGMPQLSMQHPPATRSVAATAGSNWALPYSSARSVAVWRDIRVRLEPNRLMLLSETGRVTQLVPLRGPTSDAAYEIRNAVWEDMKHWGIAGYGMHWQPVLHVDVAPEAETRFRDLQVLFENSGFAVRDRNAARPAATQR